MIGDGKICNIDEFNGYYADVEMTYDTYRWIKSLESECTISKRLLVEIHGYLNSGRPSAVEDLEFCEKIERLVHEKDN